jgi:hypothetical protein
MWVRRGRGLKRDVRSADKDVMSFSALRLLVVLLLGMALGLPRTATGLSLGNGSSIRLNPRRSDQFRLVGRHGIKSLDGVESLVLELDRFAFVVPVDSFVERKRGRLVYQAGKGVVGIIRLVLDLRHRRFEAQARGLALAGLPHPLRVGLSAGAVSECTIANLAAPHARRKRSAPVVLRPHRGRATLDACPLEDPGADPQNVLVGEQTDVRVQVTAADDTSVDPDSVRLYRADASGRPSGAALCTLVDDGSPASGDTAASDRVLGCLATFKEKDEGSVPLVIGATVGGKRVTSPGFAVGVVAPLGADDARKLGQGQEDALAAWTAAAASHGDTLAARLEALTAIRGLEGVAEAMLAGDGSSIEIHYASGVVGAVLLTPRVMPEGEDAALGPGGLFVPRPRRRAVSPVTARTMSAQVGNARALVFDPGYFPNSEAQVGGGVLYTNEAPFITGILQRAACPRFTVTQILGEAANLASLSALTQYGTVAVSTHGLLLQSGDTAFLTGERVNEQFTERYSRDLQISGSVVPTGIPDAQVAAAAMVRPRFITNLGGAFDNTVVYVGACWTTANRSLANAFIAKGAAAYLGYHRQVSTRFATDVGRRFIAGFVEPQRSIVEAYDGVSPKIDPYLHARARFDLYTGTEVAYVGEIEVTPTTARLESDGRATFEVKIAGTETCDLVYAWTNTGNAGHLGGGDTQETSTPQVTYTAETDKTDTDTLTLEVFALAADSMRTSLGTATVTVTVQSTHYRISGMNGGSFVVDDGLDVRRNGTFIHSDGGSASGTRAPFTFTAHPGDTLVFTVNDTFGACSSLSPLYLTSGGRTVLADPGFSIGCPGSPPGGVTHTNSFVIPF